jgi:SARP family transcriptional regulator, regulator of embCAB operon
MNTESGLLKIGLLGPLSMHLNGKSVAPRAAKQRQVLALLALNAGRIVTVSMLVEELWGGNPPRSYTTTLQTYVLQLRNAMEAAAGDCSARRALGTRHCGYLLEDGACRTDVEEFAQLARSGRAAAERGDQRDAAELLDTALRLWRGPALVDVPAGAILRIEVDSLEETRFGALERRIEADLALGRHADMMGELTLTAARNPMNENICAFLMTALYRSGHVARSLEAFQRLRSALLNELGVEPCPRLKRLQMAILAGDPALESASSVTQMGRPGAAGWPGEISPLGSRETERESLPSLRSAHP